MTKVIITGSQSQLALQFFNLNSIIENWKFFDSDKLDITDKKKVLDIFSEFKPEFVINCAAYTNVERAEIEKKKAYLVNQHGVKNLLYACQKFSIRLIHLSTDYVFDGLKTTPYSECDKPNPINIYGKSKLAGELEILNSNVESIIIRTSWLYSKFGKNFVKRVLNFNNNDEYNIINDQIVSPTYSKDLSLSILEIIKNSSYKWSCGDIFHYSNQGSCSWYEFANEISKYMKFQNKINKINTSDLSSFVKRPKYSVMNNSKFKNTFDVRINNWRDSLRLMLEKELTNI